MGGHAALGNKVISTGSWLASRSCYRNLRYIFRFQVTKLLTYERQNNFGSRQFARSHMPVLDFCSMY